jgi:multiple sugar transport system permease protein
MYTFKKYAYLFCIPALVMIALFALYPVMNTMVLSLYHFDLELNIFEFRGLRNFFLLVQDERALHAFAQTAFFTVTSVAFELLFGLFLALLLHLSFKGRGLVRAASLIPWAVPSVVAALLWRWIFNDRFGVINALLLKAGIIQAAHAFLTSPWQARTAVVLVEVWKTTPFMALLLLAGLQLIPDELYESAKVDGAGPFQRFRYITLPLLMPAIIVALIFRTMDAVRIFDTVYVLTGGGPGDATETLSLYAYKQMFSFLDFGMGSALAMATFLLVGAVSVAYLWWLRRSADRYGL